MIALAHAPRPLQPATPERVGGCFTCHWSGPRPLQFGPLQHRWMPSTRPNNWSATIPADAAAAGTLWLPEKIATEPSQVLQRDPARHRLHHRTVHHPRHPRPSGRAGGTSLDRPGLWGPPLWDLPNAGAGTFDPHAQPKPEYRRVPAAARYAARFAPTLAKHSHPVSPWPRRDAGALRLPVALGKSRRTTLLVMTRRGVGFPILLVRNRFAPLRS